VESAKGAAAAAQVAAKGAVISVKEAADATIFADSDDDSVPNGPGGEVEPPPVPLPVAEYQEWLLIKEAANLMPTAPLVWRRRYVVVRKGRMDVYDSKEAAAAATTTASPVKYTLPLHECRVEKFVPVDVTLEKKVRQDDDFPEVKDEAKATDYQFGVRIVTGGTFAPQEKLLAVASEAARNAWGASCSCACKLMCACLCTHDCMFRLLAQPSHRAVLDSFHLFFLNWNRFCRQSALVEPGGKARGIYSNSARRASNRTCAKDKN
jgi:hypothetical protein